MPDVLGSHEGLGDPELLSKAVCQSLWLYSLGYDAAPQLTEPDDALAAGSAPTVTVYYPRSCNED